MTVQATFAATFVDELVRSGVTDAVVCPGSRSTPLALAVATDGRLHLHVVLDERSAGFFALGLGAASGRPAVVVTTSGTAAAELHPAVVEAHHGAVPLIVCTADRPPELHHVGAPQTIEQVGLYGGAVRWAVDAGVPDEAASGSWRSLAGRVVAEAVAGGRGPGPVHVNIAFRDPLVGQPDRELFGRRMSARWHAVTEVASVPSPAAFEPMAEVPMRGLIVAGAGCGDPAAVHSLAEHLGWPVLADPRSGCRVPLSTTVAAADALLRDGSFAADHRPELVLRLGAPWASKVLGQWLAGLEHVPQIVVDPHRAWLDPDRTATSLVAADPTIFCLAGLEAGLPPAPDEWLLSWLAAETAAQDAIEEVLGRHAEPTEPGVARTVAASVPDGGALFVSSSMPVRDVEWFSAPRSGLRVFANRGANGIDGVTSTALGVACAQRGPGTVALVGDLAFLYDTNGLLIPPGTSQGIDCTIVVLDNDGGGIFSFLPQRTDLPAARFERLFGTPHGLDVAAVAAAHGAETAVVDSASAVGPAVATSAAVGGVRVVVVRTDRDANVAVHEELNAAVADALTYLR